MVCDSTTFGGAGDGMPLTGDTLCCKEIFGEP